MVYIHIILIAFENSYIILSKSNISEECWNVQLLFQRIWSVNFLFIIIS